jgi:integrase/recombinase XerC
MDLKLSEVAADYLRRYASGTRHTAKAKRVDLEHFLAFMRIHTEPPEGLDVQLAQVNASALEQFLEYRLRLGDAPATVVRRMATVKHFLRMCAEEIAGFIDPGRNVRMPVVPVECPKALDEQTVADIVARLSERCQRDDGFRSRRDQLLVFTMLYTGLRADEVRILRLGQISEDFQWFEDVRTKGRKFRKVYIAELLRDLLVPYLPLREEELRKKLEKLPATLNQRIPLFVSLRDARKDDLRTFRLNEKTIWRIVSKCSSAAGIHPHLLRHTFASRLLNSTNDIRLVAQALGHSDVRVTMKYTERSDADVAAALEASLGIPFTDETVTSCDS